MIFKFSIIIIGYNSLNTLKQLLPSLNNLNTRDVHLEIVYIDDGSKDNSMDYFKSYDLKYKKNFYQFINNKGRVHATNMGIKKSNGDWYLFVQSNTVLDSQILQHYIKGIINNAKKLIFAGGICYESLDKTLQQYLNNKSHGINAYKQYQQIHFSHLLFGNCLIHSNIFKTIKLNLKLNLYGGEELDFAFKVVKRFPNSMIACPKSIVTRIQYPDLHQHCKRLEEYGAHNFHILSPALQKEVIKYPALIANIPGMYYLVLIFYRISLTIYKMGLRPSIIMKLIFGFAILKGYYKEIK
tara:strand:- start:57 stop:947 length:891 start_codon:yes stop_codon:yes gene_type:complete